MAERADPIGISTFISDKDGRPTPFFIQQWNSQLNANAYAFNEIVAGSGLEGGGALADGEVTLSMPDVGTPDTYGSSTEIPVITTDAKGRVTEITLATVAGGGGAEVVTFTGYTCDSSAPSGAFASSFATRGNQFVPYDDFTITSVWALIDPAATSETYVATLAEISATGSGMVVDAILATSAAVTAYDTSRGAYRFELTTPVDVVSGQEYLITVSRTDATATTALPSNGLSGLSMHAPVRTIQNYTPYFASTSLSVSDTPDGAATSTEGAFWIEGYKAVVT